MLKKNGYPGIPGRFSCMTCPGSQLALINAEFPFSNQMIKHFALFELFCMIHKHFVATLLLSKNYVYLNFELLQNNLTLLTCVDPNEKLLRS